MVRPGAAALATVACALRCPHCGGAVELRGATLACEHRHRYDVARQGYVSLFPPSGPPRTGDTAAMVSARQAFLAAGHYEPIARAVADAADETVGSGLVVDLGAGTGYHLATVLDRRPAGWRGLALDASRDAVRSAIRAHPRIAGVACDVWRPLPLRAGTADLVLNVFAPRTASEIARILAPGGAVTVVTPGPRHLEELIAPLGMLAVGADKQERLRESLAPQLVPTAVRGIEVELTLTREDARALVAMGPSAHHVAPAELERRLVALPEPVTATASVVVETFRRG